MAGLRWRHVAFLLSTWAVVSFLALMVVGLAWTTRLKPQALADARAQRQEIVRVLNTPDIKQRFLSNGTEIVGSTPEEFATTIKSEIARLSKVVKDANVKVE